MTTQHDRRHVDTTAAATSTQQQHHATARARTQSTQNGRATATAVLRAMPSTQHDQHAQQSTPHPPPPKVDKAHNNKERLRSLGLAPGQTIGEWRLSAVIAEGGFGQIYECHGPQGRRAAMKVVSL